MGSEQPKETVKLDSASTAGQAEAASTQCPKHEPRQHFRSLPRGLIGTKCTAQVIIKNTPINCLMDTGSQVTTIPESFFNAHLSDHQLKSLDDLLEVEGANGQAVPYLGYINLDITFPPDFLGTPIDVATLALVVPDSQTHQPLVLVGTNTLDTVYTVHSEHTPNFHPVPYGYRAVLKILEQRHKLSKKEHHGIVKLQSARAQTIPAGQTILLEGIAVSHSLQTEKAVMVEHPTSFHLPGGLMIQSCLVDFSSQHPVLLPVPVTNESDHDVILPPQAMLAEISAFQSVSCTAQTSSESTSTTSLSKPLFNYDFENSPLTPEWKNRIIQKFNSIPEVFAKHDLDFGRTDRVKHQIKLIDQSPFKQRPRPIHPQDLDAVRKHLQDLVDSGVIRESDSPFASPIVVVRKKNGSVRLCIDYRKLNLQTIKDAYALPKLEDTFTALTGSKWFSVLDLKSGYYQIEMDEQDKCKTAFVCPLGFWEFNRMPQGVSNAPSTFQRLMEKCVGEMNLKEVLVFIDDLIVFAPTLEQHEERLMKVLNRLKEFGLKLSVEKCTFFQTSVRYLGHVVSQNGVETDPGKIEALRSWPIPKHLKELRSFLGFSGYYRRFVQGYSTIVKPLHELTSGYPPSQKKQKPLINPAHYLNPKEPFGGRWTSACQEAFETIKEKLTSAPVLAFADPKKPYLLHTDASSTGLGAVLYQEQEGQKRVIAYASRGLSRSESRYPAHKLEFLALKWAVTEKFNDYLYGTFFTVVTDSNPLTYLLTSAKLDATSYRWLSTLSTYSFKIIYRPGKQNADADGLSRRPHGELLTDLMSQKEQERILRFAEQHLESPNVITIDQHTVQALSDWQLIYSAPNSTPEYALVYSLSMSINSLPDSFTADEQFASFMVPQLSPVDIADKQRADPVLKHVIAQLETGESPPPSLREQLPELPLLLRDLNRLELHDNVLMRRRQLGDQLQHQLVLPQECRTDVLVSLHDQMGHMGIERTLDLVRNRFYWPRMANDVQTKVKTCERCIKRKTLPERAAPLVNIITSHPLELVCIDFLTLEPDKSKIKDILVITDHFTKYALAIPTPNQKARTVAKSLWENFFVHYGIPQKLHSDQGPDFESRTIKELCALAGIHKIRTTPYHPRGNPVERFNRTLLDMLGTLAEQEKSHWKDFVKPLVHAYNCTKNDTTGFTPYELMFGRQPRLPIDLVFGLPVGKTSLTHSEYVQKLKSHLEKSYQLAAENAKKTMLKNKTRFDCKVAASELDVGDRVLVRNIRLRGKHKIADRWESTVYVVVKKAANLPVYTISPEHADKPLRTLHRDLLLPCGWLPDVSQVQPVAAKRPDNPVIPPADLDDELSDEDIGPTHWYNPLISEPSRFSTTVDIPRPPVALDPEPLSDLPAELSEPSLSEPPESLLESPEPAISSSEIHSPAEIDSPVEIDSESTDSEPNLPSDTSALEVDQQIERPKRARRPPDRLQYGRLGHPILKSVQTFLDGIGKVFSLALSDGESAFPSCTPGQPSGSCQSSPCTGTYMRSGGDPVTHVSCLRSNE